MTNPEQGASRNEWTFEIKADDVEGIKPLKLSIEPDEKQRKALSKRLALHSIGFLKCDYTLQRNAGNMIIHIKANITAQVNQYCSVTLEPVPEQINESFESWFADHNQAVSFSKAKRERLGIKERGEQPIMEEYDDPEQIIDGKIDLGELAAQHFSLMLDPYPRKEGVSLPLKTDILKDEGSEEAYNNPFAALKEWKLKEDK